MSTAVDNSVEVGLDLTVFEEIVGSLSCELVGHRGGKYGYRHDDGPATHYGYAECECGYKSRGKLMCAKVVVWATNSEQSCRCPKCKKVYIVKEIITIVSLKS